MKLGQTVKHINTGTLMTIRKINGLVATCDHVNKVDKFTLPCHLRPSANVSICSLKNLI